VRQLDSDLLDFGLLDDFRWPRVLDFSRTGAAIELVEVCLSVFEMSMSGDVAVASENKLLLCFLPYVLLYSPAKPWLFWSPYIVKEGV